MVKRGVKISGSGNRGRGKGGQYEVVGVVKKGRKKICGRGKKKA